MFLGWQNLMNSLAQSDRHRGAAGRRRDRRHRRRARSTSPSAPSPAWPRSSSAIVITQGFLVGIVRRRARCSSRSSAGHGSPARSCGIVNGLVVTVLKVNPIIATLGTLAAFAGLAFLIAPGGKPVGVVTQPDFTWLGTGRFLAELALARPGRPAWPGVPIVFVVLLVRGCLVPRADALHRLRAVDLRHRRQRDGGTPGGHQPAPRCASSCTSSAAPSPASPACC